MGPRKTAAKMKALAGQRWSAVEAREVLRAQESSGLSIPSFAREHGLSYERLYRWRRQLEREDDSSATTDEIEFAPAIVLTNERATASLVVRVGEAQVEVFDPEAVDAAWLAEIVRRIGGR